MDENENRDENLNNAGIPSDQEKKDRQLDNLINIVENHTRTERHLEQYSDIGDPDNKENAREIQELREKQIDHLKSQITGDKQNEPTKEEQLEDLKENLESSEGYIENNQDHMDEEMLENLQEKQENRKIQIENLEENISEEEE